MKPAPLMTLACLAAGAWWLYQRQAAGQGVTTDDGEGGTDISGTIGLDSLMTNGMQLSASGLAFIQGQEGFSATAYPDATGYSIGYGHFITAGESYPNGITMEQGAALLAQDTARAVDAVGASVSVAITQNQFDALVDFAYNAGAGAFKNSTLLRLLNAGDYEGAAGQFGRWVYTTDANGKHVSAGLQNRRSAEESLFRSGMA